MGKADLRDFRSGVPMAALLYAQSGVIPKAIGLCEIAGCLGWLLASGAMLMMPGLIPSRTIAICDRIAGLLQVGELPFIVWLFATTAWMGFQAVRRGPKARAARSVGSAGHSARTVSQER